MENLRKYTVALVQMDTGNDKGANLAAACRYIDEAAAAGAKLVAFPEVMNLDGENVGEGGGAETVPGYTTERLAAKAKEHGIYIHSGSLSECIPGEDRAYNTCHGLWRYFTVNDGSIRLEEKNYLIIGTLEAYQAFRKYFGDEKVLPVLVTLDDGVRLQRALDREKRQEHPKYEEMCRRFLADSEDFSDEKLAQAGNPRGFVNHDLETCIQEIAAYAKSNL